MREAVRDERSKRKRKKKKREYAVVFHSWHSFACLSSPLELSYRRFNNLDSSRSFDYIVVTVSFIPIQVYIWCFSPGNKMMALKVVIKHVDMSDEMMDAAIDCASNALGK